MNKNIFGIDWNDNDSTWTKVFFSSRNVETRFGEKKSKHRTRDLFELKRERGREQKNLKGIVPKSEKKKWRIWKMGKSKKREILEKRILHEGKKDIERRDLVVLDYA